MLRSLPIIAQRNTKFLLNSWALLVTIGSDFHQSQALSRSYSSNWPNSLNYHTSMAIGFSPWRPDAVIGTAKLLKVILSSRINPIAHATAETAVCLRYIAIPQMTWFLGYNTSHIGKKSLPLSIRLTDKITKVLPRLSISLGISTEFPFSSI